MVARAVGLKHKKDIMNNTDHQLQLSAVFAANFSGNCLDMSRASGTRTLVGVIYNRLKSVVTTYTEPLALGEAQPCLRQAGSVRYCNDGF